MFSARFYEDDDLARTAAEKGLLPVYKSYDKACAAHLLVSIRWITQKKELTDRIRDEQKIFALRMYRRLSEVLLGSIVFSVILVGVTVFCVWTNNVNVTAASSLFGVISTFISGAIYKYAGEYQKALGADLTEPSASAGRIASGVRRKMR
jgi:hypothetical protein